VTYRFAISPDVHARDISSWFILNTRLQRITGQAIHATVYDDFGQLHADYDAGRVDLVLANAADTARLVRQDGFWPVARPVGVADEAVVVVAEESPAEGLDDVSAIAGNAPFRVAATDAPDVERICRILLEPADLGPADIAVVTKRNYVLVAKDVLNGQVDAGFFLRAAFDALSQITRSRLRPLISSRIYVVRHCLLAGPTAHSLIGPILTGLQEMAGRDADRELLAGLGAPDGWQPATLEEVEFMIDLMDALAQQ
jgi:phosphonate transport system substrate-binding protein